MWVILYPKNQVEMKYIWGFGNASNNEVELYALYQGLRQIMQLGIQNLIAIRDSTVIINHVCRKTPIESQTKKNI